MRDNLFNPIVNKNGFQTISHDRAPDPVGSGYLSCSQFLPIFSEIYAITP
jgi:hypothetical protein